MSKSEYKEITPENLLEPDPILRHLVKVFPDGSTQPLTNNDYLPAIFEPEFKEAVPEEVRKLYEVARGAMAYGYYFQPLYALATEQLFRVAETAVKLKCQSMGAPKSRDNFYKMVKWLIEKEVIPASEKDKWDIVRNLRNKSSHPKGQTLLIPGNAISFLNGIAEQINDLFGEKDC